jgi:hypothetical protein
VQVGLQVHAVVSAKESKGLLPSRTGVYLMPENANGRIRATARSLDGVSAACFSCSRARRCGSWIKHWRNNTGSDRATCCVLGCGRAATKGAHVQLDDGRRSVSVTWAEAPIHGPLACAWMGLRQAGSLECHADTGTSGTLFPSVARATIASTSDRCGSTLGCSPCRRMSMTWAVLASDAASGVTE